MNEEVSQKTVRFAINTGKLTGRVLWKCLKAYLRHRQNRKNTAGKGEQTVKQLVKQGQGASSMEVSGESIRAFKRIANKYGVDFAIVKDKTADPPRYTCFFKAKDMDAITAVVKEYSAKVVKLQAKPKPSLLKELKKLKDEIARAPRKVKERFKENVR
ncbi:PcfB family protein [Butyrivibrio sp.]|uniref:PcfB family protein n=1 Tax=Butyrivibrio sp. TaxID=28121 RepID=UPI0025C52C01|nr:PcfB family protein [Butyrivibrio sp.]MBQ9304601.1 PcfB family protein [Butyrivibrio sp.]